MIVRILFTGFALCAAAAACALEPPKAPEVLAGVVSPGGILRIDVGLDEERASYAVSRLGEPVILPSRLGFRLRNAEKLDRKLELMAQSTRDVDETWEQPWGVNRLVRNRYRELRVTFR
jgi:alpha-glucosidase